MEVVPESERVDHIAAELEFMHLLAVKEIVAEAEYNHEGAAICRDAARSFLKDHISRWYPKFCSRLGEAPTSPIYAAAGRLLERFLDLEMSRVDGAV